MNETICSHQKPIVRNVGFVYRPYYDYYTNEPYYQSTYISKHQIENPKCVKRLKLNDGTIIEGFGQNYLCLVLLIILFLLIIKSQ